MEYQVVKIWLMARQTSLHSLMCSQHTPGTFVHASKFTSHATNVTYLKMSAASGHNAISRLAVPIPADLHQTGAVGPKGADEVFADYSQSTLQ